MGVAAQKLCHLVWLRFVLQEALHYLCYVLLVLSPCTPGSGGLQHCVEL